jgi:uncharacterized RDD family membrane protein YckC
MVFNVFYLLFLYYVIYLLLVIYMYIHVDTWSNKSIAVGIWAWKKKMCSKSPDIMLQMYA